MKNDIGFACCIKGCDKSKNRLFSKFGLQMHIRVVHKKGLRFRSDVIAKKWGKWTERKRVGST